MYLAAFLLEKSMINFENLDKFTFPGVGKYGIPQIEPVKAYPAGEFIPMNYGKSCKNPKGKILHSEAVHQRADGYISHYAGRHHDLRFPC